jgi:D-glycero-alpha-D-manno-heptose-7-phosphate kinase
VIRSDRRTVTASAPVRLDLAGAWTDVAPFALEQRGVVVNAAIDLRTRVELSTGEDRYRLVAEDLGESFDAATLEELAPDGKLQLLKAAVRKYHLGPCLLRTSAEAPPGSGLGTSGALSVALVHAMTVATEKQLPALDVAHEAWQLETVDAAVAGGQQDQYAAALGGFQHLVFDHGVTTARALAIDAAFAAELAEHMVVCYTGRTRFSANTITRVMQAYVSREEGVVAALHAMAELAEAMAEALVQADIAKVATLVSANWAQQQRLDPEMCTAGMARLDAAMAAAGALGGKAAGAGTGGSMFYVVPGKVAAAIAAARLCGATVLPVRWAWRGVGTD